MTTLNENEVKQSEDTKTKSKSGAKLVAIEVEGGPFGFGIDYYAKQHGMETEFPPVPQGNTLYAACKALVEQVDQNNLIPEVEGGKDALLRTQPENVEIANAWMRDIQNRINVYCDAKGKQRFNRGDVAFLTLVTAIETYQIMKMKRRAIKKGLKDIAATLGLDIEKVLEEAEKEIGNVNVKAKEASE